MTIDFSAFEPHVFIGALTGAAIVLCLLLGWLKPYHTLLLLLLFGIFVGIAVDVAAHGYQH